MAHCRIITRRTRWTDGGDNTSRCRRTRKAAARDWIMHWFLDWFTRIFFYSGADCRSVKRIFIGYVSAPVSDSLSSCVTNLLSGTFGFVLYLCFRCSWYVNLVFLFYIYLCVNWLLICLKHLQRSFDSFTNYYYFSRLYGFLQALLYIYLGIIIIHNYRSTCS